MSVAVCTFGEDLEEQLSLSPVLYLVFLKRRMLIHSKSSLGGFFADVSVFPHSDHITFNPHDLICFLLLMVFFFFFPHSRFLGNQTPES